MGILELAQVAFFTKGRTKFTTSGAHDVIAITSPQKNDLCTEVLREFAKSLDTVSLEKLDSVVYFLGRERDSRVDFLV